MERTILPKRWTLKGRRQRLGFGRIGHGLLRKLGQAPPRPYRPYAVSKSFVSNNHIACWWGIIEWFVWYSHLGKTVNSSFGYAIRKEPDAIVYAHCTFEKPERNLISIDT